MQFYSLIVIDARTYDKRLRGPVDENIELSVDDRTGLKSYIASERLGIASSAGFVRGQFGKCIQVRSVHLSIYKPMVNNILAWKAIL